MKIITRYICFILIFFGWLALILYGCGKKNPPTPIAKQDKFFWEEVQGTREGNCLNIKAHLGGKYQNLKEVILELEAQQEPCPGCPFNPTQKIYFDFSSPQIKRKSSSLWISYCELGKGLHYRWRLVGINIYPQIKETTTQVHDLTD